MRSNRFATYGLSPFYNFLSGILASSGLGTMAELRVATEPIRHVERLELSIAAAVISSALFWYLGAQLDEARNEWLAEGGVHDAGRMAEPLIRREGRLRLALGGAALSAIATFTLYL